MIRRGIFDQPVNPALRLLLLGALLAVGCTAPANRFQANGPGYARTVLFADLTTPLSPPQLTALQERLRTFVLADLTDGEECSLWILGGHGGTLERVFKDRRPPVTGNPLVSNERMLLARAESLFISPLLRTLARENAAARAHTSPIREAVDELVGVGELSSAEAKVRLMLVSDLRQYDPGKRALHQVGRNLSGSEGRGFGALTHVDVVVVFIPRPGVSLEEDLSLQRLWRSHLIAAGAASIRVERL